MNENMPPERAAGEGNGRLPDPAKRPRRPQRPETPVPVDLAVAHAALSFLALAILPRHPLAIPTAAGLASTALVWFQLARNRHGEEPPASPPLPPAPRFRYDRYDEYLDK